MEHNRDKGLWLIAILKLLKGLGLLAMGIGALRLVHTDVATKVEHWLNVFRVDPDNKYLHYIIGKLLTLDDRQLRDISAGTFFYSALLLTEGIGLLLQKRWAEYFTIIVTGSFVPLEVYELFRHFHWGKVVLLLFNLAVVAYLVWVVKKHSQQDDHS